jgi:L-asparaginase
VQAVPALADVARIETEQVAQVDSKDMMFASGSAGVRVAHWSVQPMWPVS